MSRPCWKWTAAVSAALIGAAAVVVAVNAEPARSDDDEEVHVPPGDFVFAQDALANWDVEAVRESAIAAYVGAASRDAAFAPFEDPAWLDSH